MKNDRYKAEAKRALGGRDTSRSLKKLRSRFSGSTAGKKEREQKRFVEQQGRKKLSTDTRGADAARARERERAGAMKKAGPARNRKFISRVSSKGSSYEAAMKRRRAYEEELKRRHRGGR